MVAVSVSAEVEDALGVLRLLYGDDSYAFGHHSEHG
jgi:hypothetical protein